MAENSTIEWTDATWNPILGCSRVSPGCDRCYAINTATIRAGNPHPRVAAAFEGLTERSAGRLDWTGKVNLLPERLTQPMKWRKPKRIFVNSQADLFHDQVPDEYIARVFAVMARASQHTFQLLTKRHARMRSLIGDDGQRLMMASTDEETAAALYDQWPLPNVWLGVSVEDQKWANIRIPALLDTPAAVRWVSAEPLLGPLDLKQYLMPDGCHTHMGEKFPNLCQAPSCGTALAWVVAGGESGPGARPMHPDWARTIRDDCESAGVPFLFKQWGDWAPFVAGVAPGREIRSYPGFMVQRVGKKAAGRLLDGREWNEYPTTAAAGVPA